MKKYLFMLAAIVVGFSLVSCGSDDDEGSNMADGQYTCDTPVFTYTNSSKVSSSVKTKFETAMKNATTDVAKSTYKTQSAIESQWKLLLEKYVDASGLTVQNLKDLKSAGAYVKVNGKWRSGSLIYDYYLIWDSSKLDL